MWMFFSFEITNILKFNYHVSQELSLWRSLPSLKMEWVLLWTWELWNSLWFQVMWTRPSFRLWHRERLLKIRPGWCFQHSGLSWESMRWSLRWVPLWNKEEQYQCLLWARKYPRPDSSSLHGRLLFAIQVWPKCHSLEKTSLTILSSSPSLLCLSHHPV